MAKKRILLDLTRSSPHYASMAACAGMERDERRSETNLRDRQLLLCGLRLGSRPDQRLSRRFARDRVTTTILGA